MTEFIHVLEVENGVNTAVLQATGRVRVLKVMNQVAVFADCASAAESQC
jgi:hypothetical protein